MGLDEIISVTCASSSTPCLVEVGRGLREGQPATIGYVWSSGRITASLADRQVLLRRRFGVVGTGAGLRVDVRELDVLARACADWASRRADWAAFYHSCAGYPLGYGGGHYYLAPGPESTRVKIGTHRIGRANTGETLQGRDEVVGLYEPKPIDRDVVIMAEIWRRGERHGDPAGSLVGVRYVVGAFQLDAFRLEARVRERAGNGEVYLEPGEEELIAALVRLTQSP